VTIIIIQLQVRDSNQSSPFSRLPLKNVAENNLFSENVSFNTKKTRIGNNLKVSALFVITVDNNCFLLFIYSFQQHFILKRNYRVMSHNSQLETQNNNNNKFIAFERNNILYQNPKLLGETVLIWIIWFKYYNSIFVDTYLIYSAC